MFENKCNELKNDFDEVVKKIKNKDQAVIEITRESIRESLKSNKNRRGTEMSESNLLFQNGYEYQEKSIEDREKQIELITKVTNQIHHISKQTAEMVNKQGETLVSIEDNIGTADKNINSALKEVRQANDLNKSSGNIINKVVWIVLIVVVVLVLLSALMPS